MHKKAKFRNLASDWESFRRIRNEIIDMIREAKKQYIYNTCALSKHIGNMCMRLRNGGKGEASPTIFPHFAPNTHIYLYASTVHMYCINPAILNRKYTFTGR